MGPLEGASHEPSGQNTLPYPLPPTTHTHTTTSFLQGCPALGVTVTHWHSATEDY